MENVILVEKVRFWIQDDILFCKLYDMNDNGQFNKDFEADYKEMLFDLCRDRYLPLLIDLREVSSFKAIPLVKQLSGCKVLKHISLSEAFVVNNMLMQLIISVYKRIYDFTLPNRVFNNINYAIHYCLESNRVFNSNE